jgi:hypothetical protein
MTTLATVVFTIPNTVDVNISVPLSIELQPG